MKSMLKSELADAAGVSMRTFSRWLSSHEQELSHHGIMKQSRIIPPRGVQYICEMYGIEV